MKRFRRLGLQRRIMLYVAAGLVLLFGLLAFVGLASIEEATQLVYQERLATAHTTSGSLERDLTTVAIEARAAAGRSGGASGTASRLLAHFRDADGFAFFRVSGIWVVDRRGGVRGAAGQPAPPNTMGSVGETVLSTLASSPAADYALLESFGPVAGETPFAAVVVRLRDGTDATVVIHTTSLNSSQPFIPSIYGRSNLAASSSTSGPASQAYHLEVVAPSGSAVLGIGEDERPGELSTHLPAIRSLMDQRGAAALLHQPDKGQSFEPHVMAVVPLDGGPFYVVLEQPVDVALALPLQLRQRLLVLTTFGFLAALGVASKLHERGTNSSSGAGARSSRTMTSLTASSSKLNSASLITPSGTRMTQRRKAGLCSD